MSERKHVDARDIGAKQSFVASPGHDERDANGTVTIVRRVPRLPTPSWPGFVPAIHVLPLHEREKARGCRHVGAKQASSPRPGTTTVAKSTSNQSCIPPATHAREMRGNGEISSDQ